MRLAPIAFALCLAAAGASHAGPVNVSFTGAQRYTDAGPTPGEEQNNRARIAQYLQWLGTRYLPAQQTLTIELRDIDLAGELKPSRRHPPEVRVARGGADWPRITLHYTLEADGKVLRSADETVQDMSYLQHLPSYDTADPLRHEKHMLLQWFRERFSGAY